MALSFTQVSQVKNAQKIRMGEGGYNHQIVSNNKHGAPIFKLAVVAFGTEH